MADEQLEHDARDVKKTERQGPPPYWMQAIGTYGVTAVLLMFFYFQSYLPDQDARRENDRINTVTLQEIGRSMVMLVDQDRRRDDGNREFLRLQQEQIRMQQEQTRILQQIMIDQKRGAWRDDDKPPGNGHTKSGEAPPGGS